MAPEEGAFLLASKLYEWFGLEHNKIPYIEEGRSPPALSVDKLRNP